MKKIKTAFIFKPSNPYMSKTAWATTYYNFFMNALNRHPELEMAYFPAEKQFDASKLRGKFDIILLWENHPWGSPDELSGIQNLDIPVICRINDADDAKPKGKIPYHEKYKIDHYFGYLPEPFFHKHYPKSFKYKEIFYGVEPKLYENLTPYSKRIKERILCSGAAGRTDLLYRLKDLRRGTAFSVWKHYKLRTKCIKLPYVDYTSTLQHGFVNDKYSSLLMKYCTSNCCTFIISCNKILGKYCSWLSYIHGSYREKIKRVYWGLKMEKMQFLSMKKTMKKYYQNLSLILITPSGLKLQKMDVITQ